MLSKLQTYNPVQCDFEGGYKIITGEHWEVRSKFSQHARHVLILFLLWDGYKERLWNSMNLLLHFYHFQKHIW